MLAQATGAQRRVHPTCSMVASKLGRFSCRLPSEYGLRNHSLPDPQSRGIEHASLNRLAHTCEHTADHVVPVHDAEL